MAAKPLVFVSHSSADRALTEQVCQRLEATDAPGPPPCEPLVDYTDLVAGRPWPKQLHAFMARCHGAVVLLTKSAIASPWVLKEATILAWRLSIDPQFRLFVAQASEVTPQEMEQNKFGPLMLGEIQRLPQLDPPAIAREIRQRLGQAAPPPTPFDKFVRRLAANLAKVGDETLDELAQELSVNAPSWRPDRDLRTQYLETIARQILSESLGRCGGVDELVAQLSEGDASAEMVTKVSKMIAPWWVDAEAAGKLPPLTVRQPRRIAVINGGDDLQFTARMYAWRAHFLNINACNFIEPAGGSGGDLAAHYTDQICKQVRQRENRGDDYTEDRIIADLRKWTSIEYVVLPPPLPPAAVLETLADRFPKLTFIASCGSRLSAEAEQPNLEWLRPEVDLELAAQQSERWRKARQIIRNMTVN